MLTIRMYRFDFKTSAQIVFIGFLHTSFDFLRQHRHLNLKQVLIIILNRFLLSYSYIRRIFCKLNTMINNHIYLYIHIQIYLPSELITIHF